MRFARATYLVILAGSLLWCAAIFLAPLLSASSDRAVSLGSALYTFFQPICHQIEERSLSIAGKPLAVCMRCSAIYVAFLLGVLFYPIVRTVDRPIIPGPGVLSALLLPVMLDVLFGVVGVHVVTMGTRMVTGALAGLVLPFIIIPVATEAVSQLARQPSITPPPQKGCTDASET